MKGTIYLVASVFVLSLTSGCIGKIEDYDKDLPVFEGCGTEVAHPFGSRHQPYVESSIRPELSNDQLDQDVADFYDKWKENYLLKGSPCDAGHYYVRFTDQKLTVSEAHGYGMMLMVYMAGYDPDAREIFDGMYAYFRNHPSANNPDLMSWEQTMECTDAPGSNSATDGDLDIAYALLLADKQWGSAGDINYRVEARKVIRAIMELEVNPSSRYLYVGDWVSTSEPHIKGTRGSDFMPGHFDAFTADEVEGLDGSFETVKESTYQTFREVAHPDTGLIPDFILNPTDNPEPAVEFLEGNDDKYAYNSCRIPWRIGVHYLLTGSSDAKEILTPIMNWLEADSGGNPENVFAVYELNGTALGEYNDMSFIGPFAVGAMVDASHQDFLNSLWDFIVAYDISGYYGDSLKMLSMVAISGNWWTPELATCEN